MSNNPDKKILSNITPYNDVYYKSCFYHAFFPVLNHFNIGIYPFLANDVFIYKYDKDKIGIKLDLEVESQKSFTEMLKHLNIDQKTKNNSTDIVSDITLAICSERPVIIMIDCFYESIRLDAYQKEHMAHGILVYGYDDIEKQFYILEHNYRNSFLYEKRIISYTDIINSYNGFIENYIKDNKRPTYFEYGFKGEAIKDNEYIQKWFSYITNKKDEIYKGLENIKVFAEDYKEIVLDESLLITNIEELIDMLNSLINTKNMEKYHILKMLGTDHDFYDSINTIINNVSIIRGIISKFKLTRQNNPKSIEYTINKLNNLYELEKEYYDSLFSYLNEKKGLV